jgi:hypothetical protein
MEGEGAPSGEAVVADAPVVGDGFDEEEATATLVQGGSYPWFGDLGRAVADLDPQVTVDK